MWKFLIASFCIIILLLPHNIASTHISQVLIDSLTTKSLDKDILTSVQKVLETVPQNTKPVTGYRFVISSDFIGHGCRDILEEHFIHLRNGQETNKFYDSLDNYDQVVAMTVMKYPESFVTDKNGYCEMFPIVMRWIL